MSELENNRHLQLCTKTNRGFQQIDFTDHSDDDCSVWQSSAIDDTQRGLENPGSSCLWLGTVECPMHLSREHVGELLAVMQTWLKTGKLTKEQS